MSEETNQSKNPLEDFYAKRGYTPESENKPIAEQKTIPSMENTEMYGAGDPMSQKNDPDLVMTYEKVPLPSKGLFYKNGLKEVEVEYLTSRDEDLLTTPSFIEDGSVIDKLLKRKIVNKDIEPRDLLAGDRSAIILFLRASSYGHIYKVSVADPRNPDIKIEQDVDLRKLKAKEITETPDQNGEFSVHIPMKDKNVKFKLLTAGQEDFILKAAEARKEEYGLDFTEYNTMRLQASVTEIDGNRDKNYINKFIDVMPAGDAYTIRRKILDVSPDIDMTYEFKAKDGYKFKAKLSIGVDFFFPSL